MPKTGKRIESVNKNQLFMNVTRFSIRKEAAFRIPSNRCSRKFASHVVHVTMVLARALF